MALMNVDIVSPSLIIREGLLARLQTHPLFQTVSLWSRNKGKSPYAAQHIPLVAFWRMKEIMTPDGDANHAQPRFIHAAQYGVSVVLQNNDNEKAEFDLNAAHWAILRTLENQSWWRFPVTGEWQRNPFTNKIEPLKIEGVTRGEVKEVRFGSAGNEHEFPWAEQEADYTITFRSGFPPFVPDYLETIHTTVAYPWPYDPAAEEAFTAAWDVTTGGVTIPAPPYPPFDWGPQPPIRQLAAPNYSLGPLDFAKPVLTVF